MQQMANIQPRSTRALRRSACIFLGAALLSAISSPAHADVCFSTPVALPGLSGIPIWKAPGVVRTELNEPRWSAAPRLAFEDDVFGNRGLYRLMVDRTDSTL